METPDLSAVTRIQTSGGWIDIKRGSLEGASGVMYRVGPDIYSLYRYKNASSGSTGHVRAAEVIAWEPGEVLGMDPRPENMQEFDEPLHVRDTDGREMLNPFAHVRATRDVTPAGINRP